MNLITEQILLHLYDSVDYGFSYRLKKGFFIDDLFPAAWKNFKGEQIRDSLKELNRLNYIKKKDNYDGSVLVSLSEKGKLRILNMRFKHLNIKREKWDGKWRMVAFDIPEGCKKGRNALRYRLRMAGFREVQESLFLYPYDCEKEIRDFIELFKLQKYVRFGLLDFIDGQEGLKVIFKLA
jgi:phenylacetic acid degradation operon negative regulatory protein